MGGAHACGAQATSDISGTISASAKANSASRATEEVIPNCSNPVGGRWLTPCGDFETDAAASPLCL